MPVLEAVNKCTAHETHEPFQFSHCILGICVYKRITFYFYFFYPNGVLHVKKWDKEGKSLTAAGITLKMPTWIIQTHTRVRAQHAHKQHVGALSSSQCGQTTGQCVSHSHSDSLLSGELLLLLVTFSFRSFVGIIAHTSWCSAATGGLFPGHGHSLAHCN